MSDREMVFDYYVTIWSGPQKMEEEIKAENVNHADKIVREKLAEHPMWRATIYPKQYTRQAD